MDASFFTAPVEVPRLSGFDKSFQNLFTSKCGTIVPALCDEVVAGSVIDLDMAASVSLPPLASDTFMRCSLKVEAFFVPMRLCFGGFEHFFVGDTFETMRGPNDFLDTNISRLPSFSWVGQDPSTADPYSLEDADLTAVYGPGTLSDYLGAKVGYKNVSVTSDSATRRLFASSLMPYIAYHRCWDDWYRSTLIQKSCFAPLNSGATWELGYPEYHSVASLPFVCTPDVDYFNFHSLAELISMGGSLITRLRTSSLGLADGISVLETRQRNFGFDFFTCATPSPQNGTAQRVTLNGASTSTLAQGFTIAQLRSANAVQQFLERNNLAGDRYVDRLFAQYGVRPSDGIAQRVLCLGSADIEVYSKGIYNSNNAENAGGTQNPFGGSLGSRGGSAYGSTNGAINLCKGFRAAEPGYLFVMTTLVPRVTYGSGLDSKLTRYIDQYSVSEMANPILQSVGPEPIYVRELTDSFGSDDIFGYTDRYGHFKAKFDELHGLVREGESLESFALQRYIDANQDPRIDTEFLEIPTDYMDNVTAVKSAISDYGCWVDSYFQYRVSMPLSKYSLPTLQDPAYEHGKTLSIRRGGFRF